MSELAVRTGYVYSTLGLDPDLGDLVEMFVQEIPERVTRIRTYWEQADRANLERAAHQLKGAVGSYGFEALTPTLERLDYSLRMSRPEEEIRDAIEEVSELCSRARAGAPE